MKRKTVYLFAIILFVGCTQDNQKTASEAEQEKVVPLTKETSKPAQIAETPWSVKVDSATQKIHIQPSSLVDNKDLDAENVTKSLNKKYPEIRMVFLKQQTDTIFDKIPEATYMTRESGDMGSKIYMAEATYSFTQISGVNFVNFDFEEGDHASPGTYQRKDFVF
ncbi:MAG: hypothetical protein KJ712_07080 [Bacteroidetes bacterium]|nr:hypothetical protein [Bacteroidota bacterium]